VEESLSQNIAVYEVTAEPLAPKSSAWWICDDNCKDEKICHQVWIIFQQNWFKYEVGLFVLRYINLLILFGIKKNCLSSGSLCIFPIYNKGDKGTVLRIIIEAQQLHTNSDRTFLSES